MLTDVILPTTALATFTTLADLADRSTEDILSEFLELRVSINTRRTYAKALDDFFTRLTGHSASSLMVREFLSLSQHQAVVLVLKYQSILIDSGLTPSTINVRISALKSLANHARKLGMCGFTLGDVKSMAVSVYRDTSGVDPDGIRSILNTCNLSDIKGIRDYAILRLLWGNALRRGEVSGAIVGDFSPQEGKLMIKGKGKLTKSAIDLAPKTVEAISHWLAIRTSLISLPTKTDPLFVGLTHNGGRLLGEGIRLMVVDRAGRAGITKVMSPHRVRHSAITAFLDASGGDVRSAAGLSRHANLNTLTRYDDNRHKYQAKASAVLEDLV